MIPQIAFIINQMVSAIEGTIKYQMLQAEELI